MIKRIYFALLFFNGILLNSSAQGFNAGLFGGLSASWHSNIVTVELLHKCYQLNGGLFVDYSIREQYFMKMEIKYSPKGNNLATYNSDYTAHLHYVEVPFLFGGFLPKLLISSIDARDIYFLVGMSYAHLIKEKERYGNGDFKKPEQAFNKYDLLANLGFGYKFKDRYSFEIRYSASVLPIRKDAKDNIYIIGNQYNRTISLNLSYHFLID